MSSTTDLEDADLWKRTMLIAAVFLTIIVLSGLALILFSDFFTALFV